MERPEYDLKATGKQLRKLRKEKGLTVEAVRVYMRLAAPQSIYKWEHGENFPTADNLLALAKLYGVCAEEMLIKKQQVKPLLDKQMILLFGNDGRDFVIVA